MILVSGTEVLQIKLAGLAERARLRLERQIRLSREQIWAPLVPVMQATQVEIEVVGGVRVEVVEVQECEVV